MSEELASHAPALRAVAYRLVGDFPLAEDIAQETLLRALSHPPPDPDRPWRPWLVRVATRLSLDQLRRRRVRGWHGPWLPTPVSVEAVDLDEPGPEARYGARESASMAFLVALERLTPRGRAVLVMRDVLGWSAAETATALGMSEGNVKVTLLRSRRLLVGYDRHRSPERGAAAGEALGRFLMAVGGGDDAALLTLLHEDAVGISDGGGEFFAAGVPLVGRERVARVWMALAAKNAGKGIEVEILELNGLPAALLTLREPAHRVAARQIITVDVDEAGQILSIFAVLASVKLRSISQNRRGA